MHYRTLRLPPVSVFLLLFSLVGCTSVSVERVAQVEIKDARRIDGSVSVRTNATLETKRVNSIVKAFAKDEARVLSEAIRRAITDQQLFVEVVESDGDYEIEADLLALAQARGSALFSIKGLCSIAWTFRDRRTGRVLFQKKVRGEDDVSVGDAFSGAVRQVYAYEGAVRNNIEVALGQMTASSSR